MFQCREIDILKGATVKERNMLPRGSIIFALRVVPVRIQNNFKGH